MRKLVVLLLPLLFVSLLFATIEDDRALFSAYVKPNIMIEFDNSGSMNNLVIPSSLGLSYDSEQEYVGYYYSNRIYFFSSGWRRIRRADGSRIYIYIPRTDCGYSTRISGNFLNWYANYATDEERDTYNDWAQDDTQPHTRIQVAKKVLIDIINESTDFKLGIMRFTYSNGGSIVSPIVDLADESARQSLINSVNSICANTWTPLAETLQDIYAYYKGWLGYASPVQHWCQKNFVIVITDGQSTMDTTSQGWNTPEGVDLFGHDWDQDGHDPRNNPDCDYNECYYESSYYGSDYLDDIAYYLFHHDLFPGLEDVQNIITYTIGFAISHALLQDTAENGGGLYFVAEDYEELLTSLRKTIADIIRRSQSYAPIGAPKKTTVFEDFKRIGFFSWFLPLEESPIWEGHLEAYPLDEEGNFPTLGSDGEGELDRTKMLWDAGEKLRDKNPLDRWDSIYTYFYENQPVISEAVPATGGGGPGVGLLRRLFDVPPENARAVMRTILRYLAGCQADISDPASPSFDCSVTRWKLGDIFHSNLVLVGEPFYFMRYIYPDYAEFYEQWKNRTPLVYVGANDGVLHAIRVIDGEEVKAFLPTNVIPKLKNWLLDKTWDYFVDGSITGIDIKRYDESKSWQDQEWMSAIFFGLRQGGERYYAIDVTDPQADWSETKNVLWEFPAAPPVDDIPCRAFVGRQGGDISKYCLNQRKRYWKGQFWTPFMGQTWGRPRIGIIRYTEGGETKKLFAAFLTGGYPAQVDYQQWSETDKGAALFIVNATTGQIIKAFVKSQPEIRVGNRTFHPTDNYEIVEELHPLVGTPTPVDLDRDGDIDAVYVGDVKGVIWKVDLSSMDPDDWQMGKLAELGEDQNIFLQVVVAYDNCGRRWVYAGTGRRDKPLLKGYTWGFYGIKDVQGIPDEPIRVEDLQDISAIISGIKVKENVNAAGWKLYFPEDGEKLFTDPVVIGKIYFTTLSPQESGDPCVPGGKMYVYEITQTCGGGDYAGERTPGRIAGGGVLSMGEYKIYILSETPGSLEFRKQETLTVPGAFGPVYWRIVHGE